MPKYAKKRKKYENIFLFVKSCQNGVVTLRREIEFTYRKYTKYALKHKNKFVNTEKIDYLCGYKKSETRKPRFKCFHNGIILIVSSIKFYGAKIDTFFETTKQNLIKFQTKAITL